jgi:hypothetical protein
MRTTITLSDDANAAVEEVMRRRNIGRSEAVNELIRAGVAHRPTSGAYAPRTYSLGTRLDVANVGDVLDLMDQWDSDDAGSADAG